MKRISRHRIRSFLLGTGTVLTLLFTFLAILLILQPDPRDASNAHLERAQTLLTKAGEMKQSAALQRDLLRESFNAYREALRADPYNPLVWINLPDQAAGFPPALLPRLMSLRRRMLPVEPEPQPEAEP